MTEHRHFITCNGRVIAPMTSHRDEWRICGRRAVSAWAPPSGIAPDHRRTFAAGVRSSVGMTRIHGRPAVQSVREGRSAARHQKIHTGANGHQVRDTIHISIYAGFTRAVVPRFGHFIPQRPSEAATESCAPFRHQGICTFSITPSSIHCRRAADVDVGCPVSHHRADQTEGFSQSGVSVPAACIAPPSRPQFWRPRKGCVHQFLGAQLHSQYRYLAIESELLGSRRPNRSCTAICPEEQTVLFVFVPKRLWFGYLPLTLAVGGVLARVARFVPKTLAPVRVRRFLFPLDSLARLRWWPAHSRVQSPWICVATLLILILGFPGGCSVTAMVNRRHFLFHYLSTGHPAIPAPLCAPLSIAVAFQFGRFRRMEVVRSAPRRRVRHGVYGRCRTIWTKGLRCAEDRIVTAASRGPRSEGHRTNDSSFGDAQRTVACSGASCALSTVSFDGMRGSIA